MTEAEIRHEAAKLIRLYRSHALLVVELTEAREVRNGRWWVVDDWRQIAAEIREMPRSGNLALVR
jgi:hypothetical protein